MHRLARGMSLVVLAVVVAFGVRAYRKKQYDQPPAWSAIVPKVARERSRVPLGNSTRDGFLFPAPKSFSVALDEQAARVDFSTGLLGGTPPGVGVNFVVSAKIDGQWVQLFRETLGPGASEWIDHAIDLRIAAPGATELRFVNSAPSPGQKACWGGMRLLRASPPAFLDRFLPTARGKPANVILISLDTLGADHLSSSGGASGVSPNIDGFLRGAFSFPRAYVQYPSTMASHASILTGLYPKHHGMAVNSTKLGPMTLAQILEDNGYLTAAITENAYVGSTFGFDRGFSEFDNGIVHELSEIGDADGTFAKATNWIDRHAEAGPYFLFVHTYEVHTPYVVRDTQARAIADAMTPGYRGPFETSYPGGWFEMMHNLGSPMSEADLARVRALYSAEINHLDRIVGRFLEHVGNSSTAYDTLVILTADHGDEFGAHGKVGHGETLYNEVLHVPLAFRWPGGIRSASHGEVVQSVDILPTVLGLLGIESPAKVDGTSLAGVVRGERRAEMGPRVAFAEMDKVPAASLYGKGKCEEFGLPADCRVGRRAVQDARFKLVTSKFPRWEEFYDLSVDPGESRNAAADHPRDLDRMRDLLNAYEENAVAQDAPAVIPGIDQTTRDRLRALGYEVP